MPELSKLTWPENFVSSAALQDFFHNHLRIHGTFCEPLHEFSNRSSKMDEEIRDYSKLRYQKQRRSWGIEARSLKINKIKNKLKKITLKQGALIFFLLFSFKCMQRNSATESTPS